MIVMQMSAHPLRHTISNFYPNPNPNLNPNPKSTDVVGGIFINLTLYTWLTVFV